MNENNFFENNIEISIHSDPIASLTTKINKKINSINDVKTDVNNNIKKSISFPIDLKIRSNSEDDIIIFNSCTNILNKDIKEESESSNIQLLSPNKKQTNKFDNNCLVNIIIFFKSNKYIILNKFISIILHIFIMIIFEIYFYFNFVIIIEKEEFIKQIYKYLGQLNTFPISSEQKTIIKTILNLNSHQENKLYIMLYTNYIDSINQQKQILNDLLVKACRIGGFVGLILLLLTILCLFNRNKINWGWIFVENILMFLFLGIFEYLFFTNIILNYSPISDSEIKFIFYKSLINYFNSTST